VLDDGFSGSERPWYAGGAAFCEWEEGVNDALSCNENFVWFEAVFAGSGPAYGPGLHELEVGLFAFIIFDEADCFFDGVVAFIKVFDCSFGFVWYHYPVHYESGLFNFTDDVSACYLRAVFDGRFEMPFDVSLETGDVASPEDIGARLKVGIKVRT